MNLLLDMPIRIYGYANLNFGRNLSRNSTKMLLDCASFHFSSRGIVSESTMKDFEGKTVLIVDDEQEIRELLKDEFEYYGAVVLEAANGKIAAEILEKQPSDFVVTDIRMPGGDGIELLRTIKARTQSIPVLVMSAFSDISKNEANQLGADAFFSKPFNLEKLRTTALGLISPLSRSSSA